jgi:hypothetical protein
MASTGSGSGTPIPASAAGVGIVRYVAPLKTPTAVLKYSFDWYDWLGDATITASSWVSDAGISVSGIAPVGPITAVSVSGGTERTAYRVTNTVTNSNGETDTRTALIVVGPTTAGANGIQADMLVYRLYSAIPPREGTAEDYEQLIADAVNRLSQDAPLIRRATLNVISGTADYSLPDGFQALIELQSPAQPGGIINSAAGLIPVSANWEEAYEVAGNTLTFTPMPTYTMGRAYRYSAAHAPVNGRYATLTENLARLALLYAQAQALTAQANAASGNAWKYTIGDESVDKTAQSKGMQAQADALMKQYQAEVKALQGYGSTARYNSEGY